jgi:hypothetical protein
MVGATSNRVQRALLSPIAPLLFFSIGFGAILSAYMALGAAPSLGFETAASFVWCVLLALWIVNDARRRRGIPCFDFGLYCYFLLPVTITWHCVSTRGWRGILLLLAICATWILPYLVARIVWQFLHRGI